MKQNRIIPFTAAVILVWVIGYLLFVGRSLIIPLIIAIFIWHLINTLNDSIHRMPKIGLYLPNWLTLLLSLLVIGFFFRLLAQIITTNVNDVILASARYQENLMRILNSMDNYFHIKILANLDTFVKSLSIREILISISSMFTALMGSAVLIALYVIFLFVEQHFFTQKMNALITQPGHKQLVNNIISHIVKDTQTYLGLKTLMSLLIAVASFVIMKAVGLDFAEFWALLIFFLNYIPNIGSIVATAFPAILALIQFETWLPFTVITIGISTVQFIVGNLIEPKYLGQSLNVSPLFIIVALALWGSIWGVLGMVLAVPITVMMMIVFAHFDATRPIAVVLSQDGKINKAYETLA